MNFKRIFFGIVLSFALLCVNSYSEVVNKVYVEGNKRISSETIIIFGDINIGKNYESSDINSLIKKLYETNFFTNIKVELKNNILNIFVKENPIVNAIVFKGEKAKKYKERITELLTIRENTSFVDNYLKQDINIIKAFYSHNGYYFAKVQTEIENLKKNRVNITYIIDKGEKAKITRIYFLGDKKVRD